MTTHLDSLQLLLLRLDQILLRLLDCTNVKILHANLHSLMESAHLLLAPELLVNSDLLSVDFNTLFHCIVLRVLSQLTIGTILLPAAQGIVCCSILAGIRLRVTVLPSCGRLNLEGGRTSKLLLERV